MNFLSSVTMFWVAVFLFSGILTANGKATHGNGNIAQTSAKFDHHSPSRYLATSIGRSVKQRCSFLGRSPHLPLVVVPSISSRQGCDQVTSCFEPYLMFYFSSHLAVAKRLNEDAGEKYIQVQGKTYVFINRKETWEEAKTACRALGGGVDGDLASIPLYKDIDLISKKLSANTCKNMWVGLFWREVNFIYVGKTGTKINLAYFLFIALHTFEMIV